MTHQDTTLLRATGLTRRFGGLVAVNGLDIELHTGEIVGLIGPNGAGKSTTFNMLSGFLRPSEGRLQIFGRDRTGQSPRVISRDGLVRTFQHGSYIPTMTVRENIRLGTLHRLRGSARARRAEEVAELLGLTAQLEEIAGTLPHGIQRLVSIAIAFAAEPRILCLDEPLTGLNQTEVTRTLEVFDMIRREHDCAILLVEHNMRAVMSVCDRIVVMHHGKFLAAGTPDEVRQNEDVISAYLGHANDD